MLYTAAISGSATGSAAPAAWDHPRSGPQKETAATAIRALPAVRRSRTPGWSRSSLEPSPQRAHCVYERSPVQMSSVKIIGSQVNATHMSRQRTLRVKVNHRKHRPKQRCCAPSQSTTQDEKYLSCSIQQAKDRLLTRNRHPKPK